MHESLSGCIEKQCRDALPAMSRRNEKTRDSEWRGVELTTIHIMSIVNI